MNTRISSFVLVLFITLLALSGMVRASGNIFNDEFHTDPCTDGNWSLCNASLFVREVHGGQDFGVLKTSTDQFSDIEVQGPVTNTDPNIWMQISATVELNFSEDFSKNALTATIYDAFGGYVFAITMSNYNGSVVGTQHRFRCGDFISDDFEAPDFNAVEYGYWAVSISVDVSGIHCKVFDQAGSQRADMTSLTCDLGGTCDLSNLDLVDLEGKGSHNLAGLHDIWVNMLRVGSGGTIPPASCVDYPGGCTITGGLYVVTLPAQYVSRHTARLVGNLLDMGGLASGNVWFQWGTNLSALGDPGQPALWNSTPHLFRTSTGVFTWPLTNLDDNTTYYYRAVSQGNFFFAAAEQVFTTLFDVGPAFVSDVIAFFWLLVFVAFCVLLLFSAWWIKKRRSTGGLT